MTGEEYIEILRRELELWGNHVKTLSDAEVVRMVEEGLASASKSKEAEPMYNKE
ncbi:hypothetical protein QS257_07925 [Terrilactibacillus sp. S3-3]|nr:hypothetical protein QS257_07925 [Terrilactibacillus sp. S3-3]